MKGATIVRLQAEPTFQHASEEDYAAFLPACGYSRSNQESQLRYRARFVQAYPNLHDWFHLPLSERVNRLPGEDGSQLRGRDYRVSYCARPYLVYLGLHGYAHFDWEWLLAVPYLHLHALLFPADAQVTLPQLIDEAVALGYERGGAERALHWAVTRLLMRAGQGYIESITDTLLQEAIAACYQFQERADVALYHSSQEHYEDSVRKCYTSHLLLVHVVLYHRGQLQTAPHRVQSHRPLPALHKPRMEAVMTRYLAIRRLTARPRSVASIEQALRRFICWMARSHPQIETWASVTRDQVLEFAEALNTMVGPRTGKILSIFTKRGILSCLSIFFQDAAQWEWDEVPLRPLLGSGDLPKRPQLVPRYIPDDELDRLMTAIRTLECPYQRAALLTARWSGARRGEIRRLPFDCLDRYPDGTPRLHIPVGKTYSERLVPITEEAASAIRTLQSDRKGERGFTDFESGKETRYLFVRRGQLLSTSYLFDRSLQLACTQAGLVRADGTSLVSAHRFRHTVGTQLANGGAKLRTIMKVLGHESAQMSMVYTSISDPEVLKDYQAVLGPGATIAGPAALALRSGQLSIADVHWLQTNFLKTALELGHCLRLPQEGPCECELYLTCAKFITTPEYAPRLRHRYRVEQELVEDALARGWQREAERHRRTMERIEHLLTDLGLPVDGPEATP